MPHGSQISWLPIESAWDMKLRRSNSAKRHLPRLSIDSTPYSYLQSNTSPPSTLSSTRASASTTSFDTPPSSSAGGFYALCLYDFDAGQDADKLSFQKDEVLEIVKQEPSVRSSVPTMTSNRSLKTLTQGWWAAITDDDRTGWVPSAYVDPITEEEAEGVRKSKDRVRVRESPPEGIFSPSVISVLGSPFAMSPYVIASPGDSGRQFDWLPMFTPAKTSPRRKPSPRPPVVRDVPVSALSPASGMDEGAQFLELPPHSRLRHYPPSPSTPMPKPPSSPFPAQAQEEVPFVPPHRVPKRSNSYPALRSPSSNSPTRPRVDSNASANGSRVRRRRPVLIDDNSSLSRLSTLIESSNIEEVDVLARSPVVAEAIAAYSPVKKTTPFGDHFKEESQRSPLSSKESSFTATTMPHYLCPDYDKDELKIGEAGLVTAGTIPALVEKLTTGPSNAVPEIQFRRAFLMTFKTFTTSDKVFDLLIARYNLQPPPKLTAAELEEWVDKKLIPTQKKVLGVFMSWLEHHSLVQDDPPIARRLQEFLTGIVSPMALKLTANQVMNSLERQTFSVPSTPIPNSPTHKRKKTKSWKNELLRIDPAILAEHLCLYESRIYERIHPRHCLDYVIKKDKDPLNQLYAFCTTHDRLCSWVKMSILCTEAVTKRATVVDFWIKVAEKCHNMHNLSSLSAIVTALSSTVISRLNLTWAYTGRTSHLEQLVKLNEPNGNFSAYRQYQKDLHRGIHCVPFITMYLTDIAHINDQYPNNITIPCSSSKPTKPLINFVKRQRWCNAISAMLQHQGKHYLYAEDTLIMGFLEANLLQAEEFDPEIFWTKSQEVQYAEETNADIRKGLEAAGF